MIRPLRFQRRLPGSYTYSDAPPIDKLPVSYGRFSYLSHDYCWRFTKAGGAWYISSATVPGIINPFKAAANDVGLYNIRFPRLRDAVAAIEEIAKANSGEIT